MFFKSPLGLLILPALPIKKGCQEKLRRAQESCSLRSSLTGPSSRRRVLSVAESPLGLLIHPALPIKKGCQEKLRRAQESCSLRSSLTGPSSRRRVLSVAESPLGLLIHPALPIKKGCHMATFFYWRAQENSNPQPSDP